jgi:tetratricopeptide (TPR) repeat protein
VAAAYAPALRGGFIWDDSLMVEKNPLVAGEFGPGSIWFQMDFPLSMVVFWLQWLAWGNHSTGYHIVNVLLHAANAVLVWRLLTRLRVRGAWLAAALFAVHPVCVTSVAWISEQKNTLSLCFFLLSFLFYARSVGAERGVERPGSAFGYGCSLLLFVLALLTKTSTVMLPVVLLLWTWWHRGRVGWRDWLRAAPYFLLALGLGLLSIWFQANQLLRGESAQAENIPERLAGAGWAFWFYLGKALLPVQLNLIYPRWSVRAGSVVSWLPLLGAVAVAAVCWLRRHGWGRHVLFGLGSFGVGLFPVLGFFDMYYLAISRVSDHFAYLPLVGIVALVGAGLEVLLGGAGAGSQFPGSSSPPAASGERVSAAGEARSAAVWPFPIHPRVRSATSIGIPAVLILGLLSATFTRAWVFAFEERLWPEVIARNPAAWTAHNNLGCVLAERQDYAGAIGHFRTSIALNPRNASARVNLARALVRLGRPGEAVGELRAALALAPDEGDARKLLANTLLGLGERDEALLHLRQALLIKPDLETRLQYARVLSQAGRAPEAVTQFRRALATNPDAKEALNNLAWVLATCADARVRDGVEAVILAEKACRLTGYSEALPVGTLAAAYAEAGRYAEAVATARRAADLARAAGNERFAALNARLLELYSAGRAYHEPK